MKTHIVLAAGPGDGYVPNTHAGDGLVRAVLDDPGNTQSVDETATLKLAAAHLRAPLAARDLFTAALAAFTADKRALRRGGYERWTRHLAIHIPVYEVHRWQEASEAIAGSLGFLTGDVWEFHFRQRQLPQLAESDELPLQEPTPVCLFSGGLDSFVGAIDVLEQERRAILVGHYDHGSVSSPQREACVVLEPAYRNAVELFSIRVIPPRGEHGFESTTRGRSFLFLALGTLVASALPRPNRLIVAENGLISLNVPLTGPRSGSLSTRTTHPHFIAMFRNLLTRVGIPVSVELPYRFRTKGEMLRECRNPGLLEQRFAVTMSCAHPGVGRYAGGAPNEHCGYCVPCLIRRAAIRAAGLNSRERYFVHDLRNGVPSPRLKRGEDIRAMKMALERMRGATEIEAMFEVLKAGPLPGTADERLQYAQVYLRGLEEVRGLFAP